MDGFSNLHLGQHLMKRRGVLRNSSALLALVAALWATQAPALSIGVIATSVHQDRSKDYNERHKGIYLITSGGWMLGTVINSHYQRSYLVGYQLAAYRGDPWQASFLLGAASGYKEAVGQEYLPVAAISIRYKMLKISVLPNRVVDKSMVFLFGWEIDL